MPVSAYIKSLLFAEDAPNYRSRRKAPEADEKLLAEVLACVGASRIANNLNQLAKAANSGTLYFDNETSRLLPLTDAGSADRRNVLATLENIETVQRQRRRKHAPSI